MVGLKPKCYLPSFKVMGLLVLEKKIFGGFLPYMGMSAVTKWHKMLLLFFS